MRQPSIFLDLAAVNTVCNAFVPHNLYDQQLRVPERIASCAQDEELMFTMIKRSIF